MIFDSPEKHRRAFNAGLRTLLENDSAGAFILALANATFDPEVWAALHTRLYERLNDWRQRYQDVLADGGEPADAPDDIAVMLRLLVVGFERLTPTEFRRIGDWEAQFNQLRAFRPKRMAGESVASTRKPFNEQGFHFDKSFLQDEVFWQGELAGRTVQLLYNKFPFVEQHGLLVPEPGRHLPQWLTADDHEWLFALCAAVGENLPGFGAGYNAYGAYSSVNHLHFQTFVRERPLPLSAPHWRHNGGDRDYPSACQRFDAAGPAWDFIADLRRREIAYNLLYVPGSCYCLPRRFQGSYPNPAWSGGFAWYELSGGFTTFSRADFLALDEAAIEAGLNSLRV